MSESAVFHPDMASMLTGLGWEFPFERQLSLAALIRFWEEAIASQDSLAGRLGRTVLDELRGASELSRPITDPWTASRSRRGRSRRA